MRWLARQFGIDWLLKTEVVVPDGRWFPEPVRRARPTKPGTPGPHRRRMQVEPVVDPA